MQPLQGKGILSPSEQRACDENITGLCVYVVSGGCLGSSLLDY